MVEVVNANVVIGVLQVDSDPWREIFEEGQMKTWMKSKSDSIQIVNLYGSKPGRFSTVFDRVHESARWGYWTWELTLLFDRVFLRMLRKWRNPKWRIVSNEDFVAIYAKVPSVSVALPIRELALFKYFLEFTDANFLYMTNTSSYIRLELLNELTRTIQRDNVYGGTMLTFQSIRFASGANRIFSRDVVRHIADNINDWDFRYLNDVLIGKLMSCVDFHEVEIPSLVFSTVDEINSVSDSVLNQAIHYRLKSGELSNRIDKHLMHLIHSRLS